MIQLRQFWLSLKHAARGVAVVFHSEQSFRLQLLAAACMLVLAAVVRLSRNEVIVLLLLIGAVLVLEIINSILERLVDAFQPRLHPFVRDVKDITAAAVLFASVLAVVVGVLLFWPHVAGIMLY